MQLHEDLVRYVSSDQVVHHRLPPFKTVFMGGNTEDQLSSLSAFRDIVLKASSSTTSDDPDLADPPETDSRPRLKFALSKAELEKQVVETIRCIGEVISNGSQESAQSSRPHSLRSDGPFEYFCEHKILHLLVDIALQRPPSMYDTRKITHHNKLEFREVSWSSLIKAQIMETLTLLICRADASTLYYVLSQNCINDLLLSVVPLKQWTDPALEIMLPAYVDLLKSLANQLHANPHLLPLLTMPLTVNGNIIYIPLVKCTLETAKSSYTQSNSFAHATCLNLLVDLIQLEHVRDFLGDDEQLAFCEHFCRLFLDRYGRFKTLTSGPVVNGPRSTALKHQISGLDDQVDLLNDVFACGIPKLNVNLCEFLLARLVTHLLRDFVSPTNPHFLAVGVLDTDVVPQEEAASQASVFFLCRLICRLDYGPLVRMLAVTFLHPQTTTLWTDSVPATSSDRYPFTCALQGIVSGTSSSQPNPWRSQLLESLRGSYGEWRLIPVAILMEYLVTSRCMDLDMLSNLSVVPLFDKTEYQASAVELAVASFLETEHKHKSDASTIACQCMSTLAMELWHLAARVLLRANPPDQIHNSFQQCQQSPTRQALDKARDFFFRMTIESSQTIVVAAIFVDLVDEVVKGRYKRNSNKRRAPHAPVSYTCMLYQYGGRSYSSNPDILIRKQKSVNMNEVEVTRFYTQMAIHFRAICRILCRCEAQLQRPSSSMKSSTNIYTLKLDRVDHLDDELINIFGTKRLEFAGTDVDIRGRMVFRFTSTTEQTRDGSTIRTTPVEDIRHENIAGQMILVLDPTDILVVKPIPRNDHRGTLICQIPLQCIIAAASDEAWLHIAVKHHDVGSLIKNGNLALRFESPGTSLIVSQYLERCRQVLRGELVEKIRTIFAVEDILENVDKSTDTY